MFQYNSMLILSVPILLVWCYYYAHRIHTTLILIEITDCPGASNRTMYPYKFKFELLHLHYQISLPFVLIRQVLQEIYLDHFLKQKSGEVGYKHLNLMLIDQEPFSNL
jgi:hypothetical protein